MREYVFDFGAMPPDLSNMGACSASLAMPPFPSQSPAEPDAWLCARPGQARGSLLLLDGGFDLGHPLFYPIDQLPGKDLHFTHQASDTIHKIVVGHHGRDGGK